MYYNPKTKETVELGQLRKKFNKSYPKNIKIINEGDNEKWHLVYAMSESLEPNQNQQLVHKGITWTKNKYVDLYEIVDLDFEEVFEKSTKEYSEKVQKRLDSWAESKGYNDILTMCSYAMDPLKKFKNDGKTAIEVRSNTWETFFNLLDENKKNKDLMTWENFEKLLPELK